VVVPVFNEAGNIRPLYDEVKRYLGPLACDFELLFSDDGSADGTWDQVVALHEEDPRVKGIRLSRNFGHQYALFAGLAHASGDAVISMDGDLQHPPSLIPQMLERWKSGDKIVHTARIDSPDTPALKTISSRLFYRVFAYLSGVDLASGMADFRLLDRQVLDEILKFREEGLFLRGIVHWVGYPSSSIEFRCAERHSGKSKYNLKRMLKLAWAGVTSFSVVPLRIGINIGVLTSILAFAELLYAIYAKIFTDTVVPGWASAVAVLSFLFGILFILLGIIGEYIGRILAEVRNRPRYLLNGKVGVSCTKEVAGLP
jgi:dolichol-phosphate mannosyltransferase